ncbi:hypothetical protein MLD38_028202 [Melastoma candidum]|uniref:Uncharacterized protein n=1 Tax=Melastoma candidum TaxID=119954 RepID=A0ACB9N4K5_9MYRT|nr:hypothetical protein MLD38_028202 [Melastoma candidum]
MSLGRILTHASLGAVPNPNASPARSGVTCHFRLLPGFASTVGAPSLVLTSKRRGGGALACRCSSGPGGSESKNVLDAFFLGKALAEALNERIESTVGEFLSTVGRLQAEQQKQVQEFQEDVLERAKHAKETAAREALEAQGLIPTSPAPTNGSAIGSSPASPGSPPHPDAVDVTVDLEVDTSGKEGPTLEVSNDS